MERFCFQGELAGAVCSQGGTAGCLGGGALAAERRRQPRFGVCRS